jgi:hypothetical protein
MIRRFWIAFYVVALVPSALGFLALTIFCLADVAQTHELPWPFLLSDFAFGLLTWVTWRSLRREIARSKGRDEESAKNSVSAPPPFGCGDQGRVRKISGLDLICRFVRWFWRIGGLGDIKSPLWLTPFGGWFMVFLSSPILMSALVFFIRTEVFLHRSISTDGTVIRLVADHDETIHYAPVFAFIAQNGRAVTIQSTNYSAPPEFRVGQKVTILYDEDHPEDARIATHWQVHAPEDISGLIGLFFAGIGFGSLIYQRRRNRRSMGSKVAL